MRFLGRSTALLLLALASACARPSSAPSDGGDAHNDASQPPSEREAVLARAEDLRRSADVPPELRTSHRVDVRRRSVRALARIGGAESLDGLAAFLSDEDPETVGWAAYGLGYSCKGHEDAHVSLLAARAVTIAPAMRAPATRDAGGAAPFAELAILRAIGRCGGKRSEDVLTALLASAKADGRSLEPALLGLGDLATRKKTLGENAMTALVDIAGDKTATNDLAFYALSRAEPGAFAGRIADVARAALPHPGEGRLLAIRALGRAGKESARKNAKELARVVTDQKSFDAGERSEAARALASLGEAGQDGLALAINELTPDSKDPVGIGQLSGASFHALYTSLTQLGTDPPKSVEGSLSVLASLAPATPAAPDFARRLAELRCAASLSLARAVYDAEVLQKCDSPTSAASERARLASLLRRPLTRGRLDVFRTLARSEHLVVREAAVEALASHPEAGDAGVAVLADALESTHAGLVATAAELLHQHPDRALVLSEREKKAALDPRAPPPTANPMMTLAPSIEKALERALARPWPEDRFETRIALVEAASSLRHPRAKDVASLGCREANPALRERATAALRALGGDIAACAGGAASKDEPKAAAELGALLANPTKLVLTTETRELSVTLEPELSPVTATRIASLAKSGFYDGVVVHRVVPGFVVQLGDPEGDGYGGSGTSLRCETSPFPFRRFDVGMALAGRDTGSSQFFVTLSRTPHLDGEYTRIGHAEGDWPGVAQGDVVAKVRVVE